MPVVSCSRREQFRVRSLFHHVGVDQPGEMPVFDGKKVLDGTCDVRLDQVLDEHGVCVLGILCLIPHVSYPCSFLLALTRPKTDIFAHLIQ